MSVADRLKAKLAHLSIAALLLGGAVGIGGGAAFAATINCSHWHSVCLGTSYEDFIYGWENTNEIEARQGRDNVHGYGAQDYIWGSWDADNVNGGEGNDFVHGEQGNDSYLVVGGNYAVAGQSGSDLLTGNYGDDLLQGDAGGDTMRGDEHNDVLYAEDGQADNVNGGESTALEPCYVDGYDAWYSCNPY